jgi:hypothetical protein
MKLVDTLINGAPLPHFYKDSSERIDFKAIIKQEVDEFELLCHKRKVHLFIHLDDAFPFFSNSICIRAILHYLIAYFISLQQNSKHYASIKLNIKVSMNRCSITGERNLEPCQREQAFEDTNEPVQHLNVLQKLTRRVDAGLELHKSPFEAKKVVISFPDLSLTPASHE